MAKIDSILQQFRNEIGPDFMASDVVGVDGISIAGLVGESHMDVEAFAARAAMVMKLGSRVSDKLGLGKLEDNLTTTDKSIVITRSLGSGEYFWGVAVTKDAVLGTVRMVMGEFADQVWDAIPR